MNNQEHNFHNSWLIRSNGAKGCSWSDFKNEKKVASKLKSTSDEAFFVKEMSIGDIVGSLRKTG